MSAVTYPPPSMAFYCPVYWRVQLKTEFVPVVEYVDASFPTFASPRTPPGASAPPRALSPDTLSLRTPPGALPPGALSPGALPPGAFSPGTPPGALSPGTPPGWHLRSTKEVLGDPQFLCFAS